MNLEFILHKDRVSEITSREWKLVQKEIANRIKRGTVDVWYDIFEVSYHVAKAGFDCYYKCLDHYNALPAREKAWVKKHVWKTS